MSEGVLSTKPAKRRVDEAQFKYIKETIGRFPKESDTEIGLRVSASYQTVRRIRLVPDHKAYLNKEYVGKSEPKQQVLKGTKPASESRNMNRADLEKMLYSVVTRVVKIQLEHFEVKVKDIVAEATKPKPVDVKISNDVVLPRETKSFFKRVKGGNK